jgi:AraC-like DNA-binding protein
MPPKKHFLPGRFRRPKGSALSHCHAFVSQELTYAFQMLGVGATLSDETGWYPLHAPPDVVVTFEYTYGLGPERYAYNDRSTAQARRTGRIVQGHHAGFSDFFVPIGPRGAVEALLVCGPFTTHRPSTAEILERWRRLTGRQAHPSDPELAHYLSVTLGVLTLDPEMQSCFRRFLECYALLIAERGDAHALASQAVLLRAKLARARAAEQMWDATRNMVDEATSPSWLSSHTDSDFGRLGIDRLPEHVLVGLASAAIEDDPLEELLMLDAFQRECAELARSKHVITGKVGNRGVSFLVGGGSSSARTAATLRKLADDVTRLARRRFGLTLHFGTDSLVGSAPLPARFKEALGAAERAISQGLPLARAVQGIGPGTSAMRDLREQLGRSDQKLESLSANFERYVTAVIEQCGYRLEVVAAQLESGLQQIARPLLNNGILQERSYQDTWAALDQAARNATTVMDLVAAYRRAATDLVALVQKPQDSTRDRNLARAIAFVHEHFAEPLAIRKVARIAGFAPGYFSQLFKRREKTTFESYVRTLRVRRAQQLLKGTDLSADRISQLCGFALRPYFFRVFKADVGITPLQYRAANPPPAWKKSVGRVRSRKET